MRDTICVATYERVEVGVGGGIECRMGVSICARERRKGVARKKTRVRVSLFQTRGLAKKKGYLQPTIMSLMFPFLSLTCSSFILAPRAGRYIVKEVERTKRLSVRDYEERD